MSDTRRDALNSWTCLPAHAATREKCPDASLPSSLRCARFLNASLRSSLRAEFLDASVRSSPKSSGRGTEVAVVPASPKAVAGYSGQEFVATARRAGDAATR